LNEEYSGFVRLEEEQTEEPFQEEVVTSRTAPAVEVSIITPPVFLVALSNQSNLSYQSTQKTGTSGSVHTQLRNLGRSMADEMRLPTFRGDGSEDPDHHWFLCEYLWSIKNITDETIKRD
jgi:hypothetical protein